VIEIMVAQKIADHKATYATWHFSGDLFCYRANCEEYKKLGVEWFENPGNPWLKGS
jgi:hypothetical protein